MEWSSDERHLVLLLPRAGDSLAGVGPFVKIHSCLAAAPTASASVAKAAHWSAGPLDNDSHPRPVVSANTLLAVLAIADYGLKRRARRSTAVSGQPFSLSVSRHGSGKPDNRRRQSRRYHAACSLVHSAPRPEIMAMPLRAPIRVPTYTTDDLRRFPRDGQRYELLNGFLLVTPAPGTAHQVVLSRLMAALLAYLPEGATGTGYEPRRDRRVAPKHLLDPDILVWPSSYKPGNPWTAISGWWLAVEVSGRGSRVYDRDFKRDAYLALGVKEAWLVDLHDHRVLVSSRGERPDVPHEDELIWAPTGDCPFLSSSIFAHSSPTSIEPERLSSPRSRSGLALSAAEPPGTRGSAGAAPSAAA